MDQRVGVDELDRGRRRQHVGRIGARRARRARHRTGRMRLPPASSEYRIASSSPAVAGPSAKRRARRDSPRPGGAGLRGNRRARPPRWPAQPASASDSRVARSISLPARLTSSAASRASPAACSSPISGSRSFSAISLSCVAMLADLRGGVARAHGAASCVADNASCRRAENPVDERRRVRAAVLLRARLTASSIATSTGRPVAHLVERHAHDRALQRARCGRGPSRARARRSSRRAHPARRRCPRPARA